MAVNDEDIMRLLAALSTDSTHSRAGACSSWQQSAVTYFSTHQSSDTSFNPPAFIMLKTTAIASAFMLVVTTIDRAQELKTTIRDAIDNTESKAEATCLLVQVSTGTPPSAAAEQHREDQEFTESLAFREDIASFKLVLLEELMLLKEEVSAINEDDPEQFYECLDGSAGKRGLMARHLFF